MEELHEEEVEQGVSVEVCMGREQDYLGRTVIYKSRREKKTAFRQRVVTPEQ